ncbi:conserved hypothetical protein [Neospora caninum Liverpool]|uniref:Dymeclin n=1 Tax=Neospora caninum (strain Liverpool) TaxID=572307 RepID=F0VGA6_NEOCL|nr:conserved hypothetical protein [Neospora caninum Liverpool]CBZ52750.1 conserved hypothetical protein [Neospora caninum Liverpool]CEL66731.1 TPA: hypothetical protein BN1204_025380 [Neospora caninum Liverpool]|eukprot:XP_003882782.1 conserved hypothetical protein [Neospora caninum Liverpool]
MGSGSSRPGEAEGGNGLYGPRDATEQVEAFLFAVQRLASSHSSGEMETVNSEGEGVNDLACSDAGDPATANPKTCPCPSASAELLPCKEDMLQWDNLLLSLGECGVRPFSLSTPFLWNELLRPLLLGNPRNGQLKALYRFFARTLLRYAEAVECVHRRSSSSPASAPLRAQETAREGPFPEAASAKVPRSESLNAVAACEDPTSGETALPPRVVLFPCTDLSIAELALFLRILTKALCTRLSLPQLLYHLEYVPSSPGVSPLSPDLRDELLALSQTFFASLGSKRQRSSLTSLQPTHSSDAVQTAPPNSSQSKSRPEGSEEGKEEERNGGTVPEAVQRVASLESKQSGENVLSPSEERKSSGDSQSALSSFPSFPSSSPVVGVADPATTPTTTATVESRSGISEPSKCASCAPDGPFVERSAKSPSSSLSSPAFCAFLLSYRGEQKVFAASPLRSPEQLQLEILTWLSTSFPEDAVAARGRGFLFRATLRAPSSPGSVSASEERNAGADQTREVFLSVNDLACVRTLSSVLTPVRLREPGGRKEVDGKRTCGRCGGSRAVGLETSRDGAAPEGPADAGGRTGGTRDEKGEKETRSEEEKGNGEMQETHPGRKLASMCSCSSASHAEGGTHYAPTTVLVACLTVVPLWIPLSPSTSSASASSPVSTVGAVLDGIVKFLTVVQPPSPCCSPNLLRAHQHMQELLLCLFAVVCPLQLTASCLPRTALAPLPSRRKRPLQQTPHPPNAVGPEAAGWGDEQGDGGGDSHGSMGANAVTGDTRAMRARQALEERKNGSSGARNTRQRQFERLLIPPLSSPCAKLAPALYAWQQEAQRERFAKSRDVLEGSEDEEEEAVSRRNHFPPVAAAALLPDLCFIEVLLSRWDLDKQHGENRAKEFAAYLLSMVWPSSALLLSASPAFVSIPPSLAHCSLSLVLLLAFYPHPATRVSLLARAPQPRGVHASPREAAFSPSGSSTLCAASAVCGGNLGNPRPAVPLRSFSPSAFSGSVFDDVSLTRRVPAAESNVFALAFSCLFDASHFSMEKKASRPGDERMQTGSSPRQGEPVLPGSRAGAFPSLPPSSSVNFEGLLLQLCSPSSLSHPLKSLLLYLLLCRNRCFRLFCLSRSDSERLVIPLLQMLNALPRLSPFPPGAETEAKRGPRLAAPPIAVICAISLMTLSKDKSFCLELQKTVVKDIPWDEKKKIADASLGSLVVLVLLRLLSWNIRRCGDGFFLLLCSSSLINIAASVEHLHWYVADRLVDYAAALLRLLARRLATLSSRHAETLSDAGDPHQTLGEDAEGREADLSADGRNPAAGPRRDNGDRKRRRDAEDIEFITLACRSVLQFLSVALRPPLLSRNLSLLFALLRLFPVSTAKALLGHFAVSWAAAERGNVAVEERQCSLASPVSSRDSLLSSLPQSARVAGDGDAPDCGKRPDEDRERGGRGQSEEREEQATPLSSRVSFEAAAVVARIALLIGPEVRLLLDLVDVFSSSIDDAIREGSAVEEDGETSRRVVEQLVAKIPPPGHDFARFPSTHPRFLCANGGEECMHGEEGRKRRMDRLKESFLACATPGRPDFVESWGSSCFFLPLIWQSIDALTPDAVCWDRSVYAAPRE